MSDQSDIRVYQSITTDEGDGDVFQFTSSTLHYGIAAIVFAIYGIQVCPFLESLSPVHLVLPIIIALACRFLLLSIVVKQVSGPQAKNQFALDMGLFIAAALGLVFVNCVLLDAPWHSNLKVLVGICLLYTSPSPRD